MKHECRKKNQNFKWYTWIDLKIETRSDDAKPLEIKSQFFFKKTKTKKLKYL